MRLSKPSVSLAGRILQEVGFHDRLIGFRLNLRTGPKKVTMYSFQEISAFLAGPRPCMDFNFFADWLKEKIGDAELSNRIGDIADKKISEKDKAAEVNALMEQRLEQCRRIV